MLKGVLFELEDGSIREVALQREEETDKDGSFVRYVASFELKGERQEVAGSWFRNGSTALSDLLSRVVDKNSEFMRLCGASFFEILSSNGQGRL